MGDSFLQNRHSLSIHEIRAFLRVFGKITVLENMAPLEPRLNKVSGTHARTLLKVGIDVNSFGIFSRN